MAAAIKQAERRPVAVAPVIVSPKHFPVSARDMFEYETKALTLNCTGVLAGEGEAIHQFRICIRRLRGLLEFCQPVLQQDWSNRHRDELSFLGKSVGELRDTDVLRQNLTDAAVRVDDSLRGALESLHDELAERRREQHEKAIALMRSPRYETLVGSIVRPAFKQPREDGVEPPELIQPLVRRVKRAGARLTHHSTSAEFHRLRIRIKRLRYTLELLVKDKSKRAKRTAKNLKSVQDILGLQHDLVTATNWLHDVAASGRFPSQTLFAAGAVYQVLNRRAIKLSRPVWERLKLLNDGSILQDVLSAIPDRFPEARMNDKVDAA